MLLTMIAAVILTACVPLPEGSSLVVTDRGTVVTVPPITIPTPSKPAAVAGAVPVATPVGKTLEK
jgi:hypothetical protein